MIEIGKGRMDGVYLENWGKRIGGGREELRCTQILMV